MMQTFPSNAVVIEKKGENVSIPEVVVDVLRPIVAQYGSKRKWTVYTAAILLLLERTPDERDELIRNVSNMDIPGKWDERIRRIIESCKSNIAAAVEQSASKSSQGKVS